MKKILVWQQQIGSCKRAALFRGVFGESSPSQMILDWLKTKKQKKEEKKRDNDLMHITQVNIKSDPLVMGRCRASTTLAQYKSNHLMGLVMGMIFPPHHLWFCPKILLQGPIGF